MADKTWKAVERRVAQVLGGRRNPTSGAAEFLPTHGDVQLDGFYVEVKHRGQIPFYSDFKKSQAHAAKEGKPLLFILHKKQATEFLCFMTLREYADLVRDAQAFRKLPP